MTVYATSGHTQVTIGPEHGGCGQPHLRGKDASGAYVQPWGIDCPQCETFLATDPLFSKTVDGIVELHDEVQAREAYELRGAKAKDALMHAAIAQLAGFSQAQIPDSVSRMISGLKPHVPGQVVCPAGHVQAPGMRYCGECGAAMQGRPPAAAVTTGAAA
jgi:hypothetical protein